MYELRHGIVAVTPILLTLLLLTCIDCLRINSIFSRETKAKERFIDFSRVQCVDLEWITQ